MQRELRSERTARSGSLARLLLCCAITLLGGFLLGATSSASAADAPVVTGPTDKVTIAGTVTWTGTLPAGATGTCSVDGGAAAACGSDGTFRHEATGLSEGAHTVTVTATVEEPVLDADGAPVLDENGAPLVTTTTSSASDTVTVDQTAPVVTVTDPADGRTAPTWSIAFTDATAVTATCVVTGPESVSGPCTDGSFTASVSTPGTYTLTATATDAAGGTGTGTGSYELLPPPPAAPTVSATLTSTEPPAVTWSFAVPEAATAACTATGPAGWNAAADCTSGSWTTALDAGDGTYTASVVLTDANGSSDPGTASYTLDTTAPAAPSLAGPTGRGAYTSLLWTWDGAGDTGACRLERDGVLGAEASCVDAFEVSDPADGTYRVHVALVDAAGNRSGTTASDSVVVDRTGPDAPQVTSAPASPNNGGSSLSFTWNHTATATTTCRVVTPTGTEVRPWAVCDTGTVVLDVSGLPDATYVLQLVDVDDLGNRSAVIESGVALDRTPPPAPTVTGPVTPGSDPTVSVSWTETGTATCAVIQGSETLRNYAGCTPATVLDLGGLPDGEYTLAVTLTDEAGNTGPAGTTTYALDTTGPDQPTVRVTEPSSATPSVTVVWEGTGTATCSVSRGGLTVRSSACTGGSHTFDLDGEPDATYTVAVVLADELGNLSTPGTTSWVLDTTPPSIPTFVSEPPPTSSDTRPTWEFHSDPGATLLCTLTGPDAAVLLDGICSSPLVQDLSTRPDGLYTLVVRARDSLGNTSDGATSTYQLDTEPPATPTVLEAPATSSSRTPTWSLSGPAGTTLHCRLVAPDALVVHDAACGTTFTPTLPTTAPDGTYRLEVWAVDRAGNRSLMPATSSYLLDTVAPADPDVTAEPGTGSTRTPTWTVATDEGTTLLCSLTGPGDTVLGVSCGATVGATLPDDAPDGAYVLTVQARDAAGNLSGAVSSTYLLDTTAPAAPAVSAPSGPSNVREWVVTWTGEAGTRATCTLTRDGAVVETGACSSGHVFVLPVDGRYVVSVVLTDAAGNTGPAGTASYVLDTVAPAAPVVTAPAGPSNGPSWPVAWAVDEGTVTCVLSSGGVQLTRSVGCTSPRVVDLSARPDGTYVLTVWTTDAAGNSSAPSSASYQLDREPPAPPAWSAEPATSSDRTPTWSFSLPDGTTAVCRLYAPDGSLLVEAGCTSAWTAPELTGPDGAYRLEVRAVDAAGNSSTPVTSTYLLDTTPPAVPTFTSQPPTSYDPYPVWTVTTDAGTTLHCALTGPDGRVLSAGRCGTTYAGDVSGGRDGDYVLTVVATDAAGNSSAAASSIFRYDTTPPAVPSFEAEPATSSSTSPRWVIATEAGTSLRCRLTGPSGVVHDGPCDPVFTGILAGQRDGEYRLEVRAVDAAGNVSAPATSRYLLDTTPPAAPVFTRQPPPVGKDPAPRWEFTAHEGVLQCRLDGPAGPGTWGACPGTYTAALSGRPDGSYSLRVRAVDAAGNASAELLGTYRYDTTAPAPVGITPPPSPGNTRSPRWSFTAEPDAGLQCRVGDTGPWSTCTSPFTLDLTGAPDGEHAVWVRAVDAAGNVGDARRSVYVLDTVPPAPAAFTSTPPTSFDRFPTWSFTTDAGTTATCRLVSPNGNVVLEGSCSSPFTADLSGRADGTFTLTVWVRDAAGNVSAPATSTYVLDTTPPAAPVLTAPATPGGSRTPTWGIAATGTNECRLLTGDGAVLSAWARCGTSYTADLTGRPDGAYAVEVRTRDVAGNVSAVSRGTYVLDTVPPPAPGVTAPASPSPSAAPGFTVVVGETGAAVSCRLLLDGVVVTDWTACAAGTVHVDLSGRPDGTYRLQVRLTDAASNVSATAGADYVYDTTPPTTVAVTAPTTPGNERGPAWTFATEPLARLECRVGDAGDWAPCADGIALDLSTAADGEYAVFVRAVDVAGNVGAPTRHAYVLDTRPPGAPVVVAPPGPSSVAAPVWQWSGELGASAHCTLTTSGAAVWSGACASPWSVPLSTDGAYTLTVVLTDAAGNASAPGTASYVLDSTPPSAPVVVGPSSPNRLQRPVFSFTSEDGTRTECRLLFSQHGAPRVLSDWAACTSPATSTTDQPGRYVVEVRAVDTAGNASAPAALEYVYDPTATTGLLELQAPPSPSRDRLPVWTFQPVEGATATCRLVGPGRDGPVLLEGPCSTTVGPTAPLPTDGEYWLSITVRDSLGNTGVNELVYVLDTTGPTAPTVTPNGVESREGAVFWGWTGDATTAGWQCRLSRDGVLVQDWTACAPGRQDLTPFGEGAYVLEVRGLDALGNEGATGRGSYRWDLTAPDALGLTSHSGDGGTARSVVWTFPVPGDAVTATCSVRRGALLVRTPTSCHAGNYAMDLSGLPEATYALVVLFTDAAGNVREQVGSYVLSRTYVPRPAPPTPPPPAPRPPVPGEVVLEPRPRPVPAALEPAVPQLLERRAADVVVGTPTGPGSGPVSSVAVEPYREDDEQTSAPVLGLPSGPVSGARAVEALKDVASETIRRPTLPIALLLLVGLFLLVQNRIDRRDPKLAGADVDEEPELEFAPVRTLLRPARPGGATA